MSASLLRFFRGRTASAPVARERLQILLAHERSLRGQPDLLELLREEILAVVSRHVVLDPDKVVVKMELEHAGRGKGFSYSARRAEGMAPSIPEWSGRHVMVLRRLRRPNLR